MSSEPYTPEETILRDICVTSMRMDGAEFDRFIAKVKEDARNEVIDYMSRHYEDYLPLGWHRRVAEGTGGEA